MKDMSTVSEELKELGKSGLYRRLRTITSNQEVHIDIGGKTYISFSSNNYLALATHPKVKQAAIKAVRQFGCGAGASRFIVGTMELHTRLEERIAEFEGRPGAILFPTGYTALASTIISLAGPGDTVIVDSSNRASIMDAVRLSGGKLLSYSHKDMKGLEDILRASSNFKNKLIITDSIFDMDGDIAPLPEIVNIARHYRCILIVDESHSTGLFGDDGRGIAEFFGLSGDIDIITGTLNKALGSLGGFAAGGKELIERIREKAHSFIYTAALPPAVCAAGIAAIDIIESEPELKAKFWERVAMLKNKLGKLGLNIMSTESHIIPILIKDPKITMEISRYLYENGILVPGIRFPTVTQNTARLRITVMVTHTHRDINRLAQALEEAKGIFL